MAFSPDEDIFLPDKHCEICGAELTDEVVIQEFADGSIARLCSECAAGAALQSETAEFQFPDVPPRDGDPGMRLDDSSIDETRSDAAPAAAAAAPAPAARPVSPEADILEKTRELMTPVVDLMSLQADMQGALQRLATSLQTFATGVITEKTDKDATMESRLEALEKELEATRTRLRDTEALLEASTAAAAAAAAAPAPVAAPFEPVVPAVVAPEPVAPAAAPEPAPAPQAASPLLPPVKPDAEQTAPALWDFEATVETTAETSFTIDTDEFQAPRITQAPRAAAAPAAAAPPAVPLAPPAVSDTATQPFSPEDLEETMPPVAPKLVPPPVAPPAGPPTAEHHSRPGFQLPEVQIAQRYFNESNFTTRIRDVRKSLGKPKANLTKLIGTEPRALVTIAWDIIWYQYLVDLRRDIPVDARVILHREGMDLDELAPVFKDKNASVDDEGRLDASELEVKLLSDPSTLITEMSIEEERALEDATEEIWDQRTAPEFKWDD